MVYAYQKKESDAPQTQNFGSFYSMGIDDVLGYDLINSIVMTELSRNDWWCQKQ